MIALPWRCPYIQTLHSADHVLFRWVVWLLHFSRVLRVAVIRRGVVGWVSPTVAGLVGLGVVVIWGSCVCNIPPWFSHTVTGQPLPYAADLLSQHPIITVITISANLYIIVYCWTTLPQSLITQPIASSKNLHNTPVATLLYPSPIIIQPIISPNNPELQYTAVLLYLSPNIIQPIISPNNPHNTLLPYFTSVTLSHSQSYHQIIPTIHCYPTLPQSHCHTANHITK